MHLSSARTPLRELLQPSSLSDEGSLEDLQGHRQPAALMRERGVLDAATAPLPTGYYSRSSRWMRSKMLQHAVWQLRY